MSNEEDEREEHIRGVFFPHAIKAGIWQEEMEHETGD